VLIAIFYVAGLAAGVIAGATGSGGSAAFAGAMLRWVLLVGVGVPLLISGLGHVFRGETAARRLGWPSGNPFQTELGIWDGAGGVIAIVAFWRHGDFWLATVIAQALFWTGGGDRARPRACPRTQPARRELATCGRQLSNDCFHIGRRSGPDMPSESPSNG
jgi:hypothetical protein